MDKRQLSVLMFCLGAAFLVAGAVMLVKANRMQSAADGMAAQPNPAALSSAPDLPAASTAFARKGSSPAPASQSDISLTGTVSPLASAPEIRKRAPARVIGSPAQVASRRSPGEPAKAKQ